MRRVEPLDRYEHDIRQPSSGTSLCETVNLSHTYESLQILALGDTTSAWPTWLFQSETFDSRPPRRAISKPFDFAYETSCGTARNPGYLYSTLDPAL